MPSYTQRMTRAALNRRLNPSPLLPTAADFASKLYRVIWQRTDLGPDGPRLELSLLALDGYHAVEQGQLYLQTRGDTAPMTLLSVIEMHMDVTLLGDLVAMEPAELTAAREAEFHRREAAENGEEREDRRAS